MTLEQQLLEKLRGLSPDKQQEVLNFAESLSKKASPKEPLRSLEGLWADLNIQITEEDIGV
jgi:hypothetical protein